MSDAALAAVAGLIGVALSGGVQVGLEVWRDHKIRRAAVRPVVGEVSGLVTLLAVAVDHPVSIGMLPEPDSWLAHEEVLSRELPDRTWDCVVTAYASYDTLRTLNGTFKDSGTRESEAMLVHRARIALRAMDDAHLMLSRPRWRRRRSDLVMDLGETPGRAPAEARESGD